MRSAISLWGTDSSIWRYEALAQALPRDANAKASLCCCGYDEQVLNLSFNCLVSKDVEELSNLLRIRELYLCNNWIRSLPPTMDRFSRLETLSLERNNIAGEEIFALLSMVPRLRNLNLSHNKLAGFPEVSGFLLLVAVLRLTAVV